MTGHGSALILAKLLRDPANWPSIAADSELLRQRIALGRRCSFERRRLQPFLARYGRAAA